MEKRYTITDVPQFFSFLSIQSSFCKAHLYFWYELRQQLQSLMVSLSERESRRGLHGYRWFCFSIQKEGAENSAPSWAISVQNLHQSAAAEGDGLACLDVLGLVAGDAVDVRVVGRADDGNLVLLL